MNTTRLKAAGLGVLIVTAALSARMAYNSITGGKERENTSETLYAETSDGGAEYYLRERDGFVCVFTPGSGSPVGVTGISVSSLRESDRAIVSRGIAVRDREELLTLLEDLGS